jgi:hypothetical protein
MLAWYDSVNLISPKQPKQSIKKKFDLKKIKMILKKEDIGSIIINLLIL